MRRSLARLCSVQLAGARVRVCVALLDERAYGILGAALVGFHQPKQEFQVRFVAFVFRRKGVNRKCLARARSRDRLGNAAQTSYSFRVRFPFIYELANGSTGLYLIVGQCGCCNESSQRVGR